MSEYGGTYNIEINTPMGAQSGTLTLVQDGDGLTGAMAAMGDEVEVQNGRVENGAALWEVSITKPMPMTLEFSGTLSGDALSGKVKLGAFGESDFNATKA